MILKRGTMLDATLIETAAARPPMDGTSSDPDARFAKREGKAGSVYGYQAHVGVDEGSGIIRSVITTPANVNDTTPADDLIGGTSGRCGPTRPIIPILGSGRSRVVGSSLA